MLGVLAAGLGQGEEQGQNGDDQRDALVFRLDRIFQRFSHPSFPSQES